MLRGLKDDICFVYMKLGDFKETLSHVSAIERSKMRPIVAGSIKEPDMLKKNFLLIIELIISVETSDRTVLTC